MGLFSLYLIRSNERIIGREPSYVLRQEWQKGPRLMCIAQHLNCHFGRGVSVFLLLLASGGCTSHQGVSSPVHGEMIPKRPQWSRAVTALSHTSRLPDPDSLYVYHYRRGAESGMEDRFPAVEGYHFFRFWPNGRFRAPGIWPATGSSGSTSPLKRGRAPCPKRALRHRSHLHFPPARLHWWSRRRVP